MRKRVICLLVLVLISSSGTVFATNWVFFAKGNSPRYGDCDTYIDKDTVLRNGSDLIFNELDVLDNIDQAGSKKYLFKIEAITLRPRKYSILEYYVYDANDNVIYQKTTQDNFSPVDPRYDQEIDFALQYAKDGQDIGQKNMVFDYDYQAGSYLRKLRGTVKDPQGLWQALLPLQPPPGARGDYGLIGDDSLLGQKPGFGLRQLGKIARRYISFDFVYVVQPPGFWEIGVQGGVFTSVEALNDTTLGWIFFDLRSKFEADLKKFLNLAPDEGK